MRTLASILALACLGLSTPIAALEGYREPPAIVTEIVDADPSPSVSFSPDHRYMVHLSYSAMPSIEDLSRRMLRLAGMRIDPQADSRFRTTFGTALEVRRVSDGQVMLRVAATEGERLASTDWSHDSNALAWISIDADGSRLNTWVAGGESGPRRHPRPVTTVLSGMEWMPDGRHLLVGLVPAERGEEPAAPVAPRGPNIQESSGNTSPTRTFQDLLANPHDEKLFDHYATAQLALVGLDGTVKPLGRPGLHFPSAAPDGRHIMVESIHRPYSYLLGYWSFPTRIEVWNLDGEVVHTVAELPMAENIPIGGVRIGPRSHRWMNNAPATLLWTEALDGGDPKKEVPHRDRLIMHAAPFEDPPKALLELEHRYSGVGFLADPTLMWTTEYDRDRRWIRTILHDLTGDRAPRTVEDRSVRDRYGNPGSIVMTDDDRGRPVPLQHGDWIYRVGQGASPEGDLPFLDRQNLQTLNTERLWRCEQGTYERPVAVVSGAPRRKPTVITVFEAPTTPPNYRVRDLAKDRSRALTDFPDPTPQIRGVRKQLVTYEREDGVPLSATLYLPEDYQEGQRLPLIVWAYPREFNDVKTAGQVAGSDSRFTRIGGTSHLTLLTQGYAIMNNATMPVIGDPETMNDTFIDQIVSSAKAAIDKAVEMGVADPQRVGVGGHSYGAFMTANLLAHSDLFAAGLARSGAYNRTLTPFGFQSERRSLWDAREVYFTVSPFMHANKIDEPVLLIHGEADNNSGTFPMQSRRMYQAIKGNGGTVRLVMLPNESHGYRARESVLHVQAEMIEWFDRFLRPDDAEVSP